MGIVSSFRIVFRKSADCSRVCFDRFYQIYPRLQRIKVTTTILQLLLDLFLYLSSSRFCFNFVSSRETTLLKRTILRRWLPPLSLRQDLTLQRKGRSRQGRIKIITRDNKIFSRDEMMMTMIKCYKFYIQQYILRIFHVRKLL